MIFVGDIAIPHNSHVRLNDGDVFNEKNTIANLGGCIVPSSFSSSKVLYNDDCVIQILKKINCSVVGLANNHVQDVPEYYDRTKKILAEQGIYYRGIANENNFLEKIILDNEGYYFLNYAWVVTGVRNRKSAIKIQKLELSRLIGDIKAIKANDAEAKILLFFHWGYELEAFPLPMDRIIAKKAIDFGCYAVIGCHSHCIQGVEVYKGRPIVYGLGNFFVPEGEFLGKKLSYPPISHRGLAFEMSGNDFKCHWFRYDTEEKAVTYEQTTNIDSMEVAQVTPYAGMGDKDYLRWFSINRRKKMLLPIFRSTNQGLGNMARIKWVQFRQLFILLIVRLGIKKAPK